MYMDVKSSMKWILICVFLVHLSVNFEIYYKKFDNSCKKKDLV